jgi:hypothetical protein
MQQNLQSVPSDKAAARTPIDASLSKPAPLPLDASLLKHVGGGLSPKGTWGADVTIDSPKGTW